ncbi:MAG: thioredoxin family protein [Candidatus Hydrothermarchaeales archaeon]
MNEVTWIVVDSKSWDEVVLNSDIPVVVDFWAPNCPYCERLRPIFEELSSEYKGRMRFVKLNAEKASDIATIYGVMSIPMLKFFCGGREVYGVLGYMKKEELKKELDKVLSIYTSCLAQSTEIQMDPMIG